MSTCSKKCSQCSVTVRVVINGDAECPGLTDVIKETFLANNSDDIAVIARIGGKDIAIQCAGLVNSDISLWG